MSQQLKLKIRGLYTDPNNFSEVPEGALAVADNVVIDKDSILESRRGFTFYGSVLEASAKINKLFTYKESLIASFGNGKLAYDSDSAGSWVPYAGTWNQPDTGYAMHSIQANRNFYFTTSQGIQKIDSLTGTIKDAGAVRALSADASLNAASGGFLSNNAAVAYRIVWGYKDANSNLVVGSPSQRIVISNESGVAKNVDLIIQIPPTITTSFFFQVYRSLESVGATVEPNDELGQVFEGFPNPSQITAGFISLTDITPSSLRGAALYTNPNREGILQSNEAPPFAKDIAVFKGYALYANTRSKQRMTLTLFSADPSDGLYFYAETGDIVDTSTVITNIGDTSVLRVGMKAKGTGIPASARIISIDTATAITISHPATATTSTLTIEFQDVVTLAGVDYFASSATVTADNEFKVSTGPTPAEAIALTTVQLIKAINQSFLNTSVYAYYLSGYNELPGKFLLEERDVGASDFYATSNQGGAFNPELPSSGSALSSDNDEAPNRVYISKLQQPEAVPLIQSFDVGSKDSPIRRIISLRDSVFILKDDGIYRLFGEDVNSFRVVLADNTSIIRAPEAAVAFNNQVMMFSEQGVVSVSENGVSVLSRPIESTLLQLSSASEYPAFETSTFAVSYESDRKYILFTVSQRDDSYATQSFVFNSFSNSWTRWIMPRSCGLVKPTDNKMYSGHPTNGSVYCERKTFTSFDYADEQYPLTITAFSGNEMTVTDASSVEIGMSIGQTVATAKIVSVLGNVLTVDRLQAWEAGLASLFEPIRNEVKWLPLDIGNPGILKNFREITLFFRDAAFRSIDLKMTTNFSPASETVTLSPQSRGAWGGFQWGSVPWGGGLGGAQALRTYVVLEKRRASWLNLSIINEQAFTSMSLSGLSLVYEPMSERFF